MISFLAQLLVLNPPAKKEAAEREDARPYRAFCADCDEEGRDARHPCPGH